MLLNLSCPAVSNIYTFMILLSIFNFLTAKSMPTVGMKESEYDPSLNLLRRHVLPTDEFPITNNLII